MTKGVQVQTRAEGERLQALHSLRILDTPREERFDRIVRLAQRLFEVPMAAVTLVDADRQWIKSSIGLASDDESPRSEAICDHTIREEGPLVIPDLAADDRFASMPYVTGETPLRFYAGHPLEAGGQRVGALCLMDEQPRQLSSLQLELLAELSSWVERELASTEDLRQAAAVQRLLQPRTSPDLPGYDVAGGCLMASAVGGDLYDWYPAQDQFQFLLGDVMGKGIGAALIAAGVRATIRGASRYNDLPEAITRAAASLQDDLGETGAFVTAFAARLQPATGTLEYVDAGHGLAIILGPDGAYRQLTTGGLPIGTLPDDRWESRTTTLAPGETLVSVSDGLLDCFSDAREALTLVQDSALRAASAGELADRIIDVAHQRVATDDVTVIIVRRAA